MDAPSPSGDSIVQSWMNLPGRNRERLRRSRENRAMLSILGQQPAAYCDGHSRRHFLEIGGLAMGGLGLPQVLRAQAATGPSRSSRRSHKAVIMIYLSGGPSHQDMYDLKMNAPAEIRGSFRPIPTNVPGIEICEHMPRLARMMDKFTIIRSLYGSPDQHNSDMCMSEKSHRTGIVMVITQNHTGQALLWDRTRHAL